MDNQDCGFYDMDQDSHWFQNVEPCTSALPAIETLWGHSGFCATEYCNMDGYSTYDYWSGSCPEEAPCGDQVMNCQPPINWSYELPDQYRDSRPGSVSSGYKSDPDTPSTADEESKPTFPKERKTQLKQKGKMRLPHFLHLLLTERHKQNPDIIKWLDEDNGIFKICDSKRVAQLWGLEKNNDKMTFPSMSRGIRDRKKDGSFVSLSAEERKAFPKKLVFKFGRYVNSSCRV